MITVDPANVIRRNQAVGNMSVKAPGTETRVSDAVIRRTVKAELREDLTVCVTNLEKGRPIGTVYAAGLAEVV
jgi:hypothetical protein